MEDSKNYKNVKELREATERKRSRERKMSQLRTEISKFEDLIHVVLRRNIIEKWADEPFFDKTLIGSFVKFCRN